MWYVYILKCADGSYYTGVTNDVSRRFREHLKKTSHYTGYNPPTRMLYQEAFEKKARAEEREAQLKRWSRAKKAALIHGDLSELRSLSVSRD